MKVPHQVFNLLNQGSVVDFTSYEGEFSLEEKVYVQDEKTGDVRGPAEVIGRVPEGDHYIYHLKPL